MVLSKLALNNMIENDSGHIINIASVASINHGLKVSDYCATKHAVYGFNNSLRLELKYLNKSTNIKVSMVCPYAVDTGMVYYL